MNYSVEDLIKELSKYPKEMQIRTVAPEAHSFFYFKLDKPVIELQEEDGVNYVVVT